MFITGIDKKYPEELLKNRSFIEGNVIGCIYSDLLILDEFELKSKDFLTQDGRFYFELAKNVRNRKYNAIDDLTILSSQNEIISNGYERRGGWQQIQNIVDVINDKNIETYLDNLYKENIILNLYENGFNLFDPIEIKDKKISPLKLFDKMNSEMVIDWYESKLSSLGTGYSSKILEEEELDIDDEFIESCQSGEEMGVPFDVAGIDITGKEMKCLPDISSQICGFTDGSTSFLGGYSSTGKSSLYLSILLALIYRGRKVLMISNEQKVKVFKTAITIWLLCKHFRYYKITKKKLKSGNLTDEDKEMIKKVQQYWRDNYKGKFKFISIPDTDIPLAKKKIRENVLRFGYDTVLYDTFKLDISNGNNDNHWMSLIKDSRELDKIAKKYNIIMLCSIQLAINSLGKLFLDASVLSNSKGVKEILENLLLMRIVYPEELDESNKKYYCNPFKWNKQGSKWIAEKVEVDKSGVYRMMFIDKSREGNNSGDDGIAYLLKFNGAQGIFQEYCLCKSKHTVI